MKSLLKIVGVAASLVAVLAMLGGHWLVLQSAAWAGMIVDYSQHGSLAKAIERTFDGDHPCPLCLKIREGRQEEQKQDRKLPWVKPDKGPELFYEAHTSLVPAAPTEAENTVPFVPSLHPEFIDSPLSPPPRGLLAAL